MEYRITLTNINPNLLLPSITFSVFSEDAAESIIKTWVDREFEYLQIPYDESSAAVIIQEHKKDYFLEVYQTNQKGNNS